MHVAKTSVGTASPNWRQRVFVLLESSGEDAPLSSQAFVIFIVGLIICNVFAVIFESDAKMHIAYNVQFAMFEIFSVIVFTAEYLARIWVAPEHPMYSNMSATRARLKYVARPLALIDLLAIAPFFLALFIPIDLRYLRLFRLLRLLKLSHYFDGLHMFLSVVGREIGAIAGAILTLVVLIIISACLMFSIEHAAAPGHFDSVAEAIWWSVVTLTTVGYGDITPITFLGKFVAMIIMLLGVCTMALPAGILAAKFTEELQMRREMMKQTVNDAFRDGIMDADERRTIAELQEELELPEEVVERLVAMNIRSRGHSNYCPHCGESLQNQ